MPPIPALKQISAPPSDGAQPGCLQQHPMPPVDVSEPRRLPIVVALKAIRLYKILVSPMFAGSCRYLPSCSDYAAEAIYRFGVIRGSWLAAARIARCHPLGGHGLDPVPADTRHSR